MSDAATRGHDTGHELGRALLAECERRLIAEGQARLERCIDLLDDDQVWWRPHDAANSVGNLVLHLSGNVRQWIVSGLGGAPDHRQRAAEFAARGPLPRGDLRALLAATMTEAAAAIRTFPPDRLLEERRVQGFRETPLTMLVHVVEHFSYHVGQVTFITKSLTKRDTGYYQGTDLGRTGSADG